MPSFPPISGPDIEVLILGSMPSRRSLHESRYYAHPRNAFWWIMSQLLVFPEDVTYEKKIEYIKASNYGLWDVLYDCQREGSLDSNIERDSEQVNDFVRFFKEHVNIKLIAFNGAAASKIFMRHFETLLQTHDNIKSIQLPSTSPAHASITRASKLEQWRIRLDLESKSL